MSFVLPAFNALRKKSHDSSSSNGAPTVEELQAELASLHKAITIINHLAAEVDIHAAMDNVRQVVLELLNCEKVTLYLVSERRQELRGLTHGLKGDFVIRVKFGEGIAGTVAATGQLMNIADTYSHPLFNSSIDRNTGFRTRNLLCCAIRDQSGRNVAVLQALNKHGRQTFTGADENTLKLFGTHLGNTIAKARLHESAQREKKRLSALYTCFKAMAASDGLDELLLLARTALYEVLHVEHAFVFLLDAPRNELWTKYHIPGKQDMGTARVAMGTGLVGKAAEQRAVRILGSDSLNNLGNSPFARSNSASNLPTNHMHPNHLMMNHGRSSFSSSGFKPPRHVAHQIGSGGSNHSLGNPGMDDDDMIDDDLLRQIAPALGNTPIMSVLVQPLLGDDKVVGAILVVNKRELGSQRDILFEDYFTEGDMEAMALMALELGNTLNERSLECALASALSVIGPNGGAPGDADNMLDNAYSISDGVELSEASDELMVRSQLISMYFQSAPDYRRPNSEGSANLSPMLLSSPNNQNNRARWQRTLTKLGALNRLSVSHSRIMDAARSDGASIASANDMPSPTSRSIPWSSPGNDGDVPLPVAPLPPITTAANRQERQSLVPASAPTSGDTQLSTRLPLPEALQPLASGSNSFKKANLPPLIVPHGVQGAASALHAALRNSRTTANEDNDTNMENLMAPTSPKAIAAAISALSSRQRSGSLSPPHERPLVPRRPSNLQPQGSQSPLHRLSNLGMADDRSSSSLNVSRQGTSALLAHYQSGVSGTSPEAPSFLNGGNTIGPVYEEGSPGEVADGAGLAVIPSLSHNHNHSHSRGHTSFYDPALVYSWEFNMLDMDRAELVKLCYDLFMQSGLISHFNLSRKTLRAFLTAVSSHYHGVPYHNFNHVCHVLHGVCMFIRIDTICRFLPHEERLALLVAALCHDLDHDGGSNNYHVNSQSELARIYNDISVMESHHCAMTWAILRRKECALLDSLDKDTQKRLRKAVVAAILSTDMSHHFGVTQEFKKHSVLFDPELEADRLLLIKVLLHASDIGSGVRPFDINDGLSKRVHLEFQALAEKEISLGLPITFAVDPSNPRMCAQIECNFLDYVVSPLWERLGEVVPELEPCWKQLTENRKSYHTLCARLTSASGVPEQQQGQ